MNMQSGNSWQTIFIPQQNEDEALDNFMENFFEVSACDYTDDELLQYSGYSSSPVDDATIQAAAASYGIKLPAFHTEFIPATNWLTQNVIKFPALETKDFYIHGTHEDPKDSGNKHRLRIYAATAFGSGQHQTTRSCLELLSSLYHKNFEANNVLDMGCGSGILALAALKLWSNSKAVAADIDNEAVIVTLQNAADNNLSERLTAATGDGYQNQLVQSGAPYDLIFSNILARPLIEMAPNLSQSLRPNGYAILSGFIDEQTDWVIDAHRKMGLELVQIIKDENWRAILMEKIR